MPTIRMAATAVLAPLALAATLSACNGGEKSAKNAAEHAAAAAELIASDVGEVTRGLPAGAKKSVSVFYEAGNDPAKDPIAVRRGLNKVQVAVPDLLVAKSTFFALSDASGVVIRNNLEVDAMAGTNLFKIFPALAQGAPDATRTALGLYPGAQDARTWVAAAPIVAANGTTAGYLITGWSYQQFAYHLQESGLSRIKGALMKDKQEGKLPIVYVGLFDESGVYVARTTPEVNASELKKLDLVSKTQAGPVQGVLEITGRTFGYAARRTPELGPNSGIAILRSEI